MGQARPPKSKVHRLFGNPVPSALMRCIGLYSASSPTSLQHDHSRCYGPGVRRFDEAQPLCEGDVRSQGILLGGFVEGASERSLSQDMTSSSNRRRKNNNELVVE
uniref:Uncharacterized protein n=1 Tax=Coccidioides posadasii RMSCC 3488 TaxID=454284 RepID=A0A0J6FTY5_COCPO|nr:hypothetical protein CPAG_09137 [Coccidioides posadasii RMSCC 3488]